MDARGSVGLTVIGVQHGAHLHRLGVYWQAPYDFNLYKNSFAVFPITGDQAMTSKEVLKTSKTFLDYSNTTQTTGVSDGIRGFASDGPRSLFFSGLLISVKMGVKHKDCMQVSIIPLEHDNQ